MRGTRCTGTCRIIRRTDDSPHASANEPVFVLHRKMQPVRRYFRFLPFRFTYYRGQRQPLPPSGIGQYWTAQIRTARVRSPTITLAVSARCRKSSLQSSLSARPHPVASHKIRNTATPKTRHEIRPFLPSYFPAVFGTTPPNIPAYPQHHCPTLPIHRLKPAAKEPNPSPVRKQARQIPSPCLYASAKTVFASRAKHGKKSNRFRSVAANLAPLPHAKRFRACRKRRRTQE